MARDSPPPPLPPDPGSFAAKRAMEETVPLPALPSVLNLHPGPMVTFARVVADGLGTMPYRWAPRLRLAALLIHGTFPAAVLRPYMGSVEQEVDCVDASAELRQEEQELPFTKPKETPVDGSRFEKPILQDGPPDPFLPREDHGPKHRFAEPYLTGNYAASVWSTVENQQTRMLTKEALDSMNDDTDTNVPKGAGNSSKKQKYQLTKFFVKISGHSISLRENTNVMTVQRLVELVCEMKGQGSHDCYAVYAGKALDSNQTLSHYAIGKESTIEIRTGERGGRPIMSTQGAPGSLTGNIDTNVPKGADDFSKKQKHQPTQFFVKLSGHTISVYQNTRVMTVERLIDRVCEMKGQRSRDCYAVYAGKRLDDNQTLSHYAIYKDSTVEIRTRGRGGRNRTVICRTFDEMLMGHNRFHTVRFPPTLRNRQAGISSATFLSGYMQWFARQILITLCRMHFRGKSFNGAFDSTHILFHDGHVIFDEALVEVDFTAETCKEDYKAIEKIFRVIFFISARRRYPLFVGHLLRYLRECPAGINSNSEACIAFLIRHPALTSYTDRMAQCTVLDSMVARLNAADYQAFEAAVRADPNWASLLLGVSSMSDTYFYPSNYNAAGAMVSLYEDDPWNCLHYSRNYFKHASLDLQIEKIEAAFCANVHDFLADLLQDLAIRFQGPPTFDIVTLLGNYVEDNWGDHVAGNMGNEN